MTPPKLCGFLATGKQRTRLKTGAAFSRRASDPCNFGSTHNNSIQSNPIQYSTVITKQFYVLARAHPTPAVAASSAIRPYPFPKPALSAPPARGLLVRPQNLTSRRPKSQRRHLYDIIPDKSLVRSVVEQILCTRFPRPCSRGPAFRLSDLLITSIDVTERPSFMAGIER